MGDLLSKSPAALGVETQKRSPIANETRVRGYNLGQTITQADGAFWFPARQDLDTFLSKIDSGIVKNVVVVKGPYSALYGPGFAFIDIDTFDAPRYTGGFEIHGRTAFDYKDNGRQFYGRQSIFGGSSDYGFRFSYGQRTGNDYTTGAGIELPSSYNSRDIDFVYGVDPTPNSHIEFGYLRLDQTNLEFPGQIFDTAFLITNGFRLRYVLEDQYYFDKLTVEGYYNRTSMAGNAQNSGKRLQIPQLDAIGFMGFTDIDQSSAGGRAYLTWGEREEPQLTVGADLRYMKGQLNENDMIIPINLPCLQSLNFPVPRSHQSDVGGLFAEYLLPVEDRLVFRTGVRGDYARANIDGIPPGYCFENFIGTPEEPGITRRLYGTTEFDNDWRMLLAYATAEYKLTPAWTVVGGFGHAQRPPTTTELYALQPFLAILQQGFTTVVGNPRLATEKLWQMDLGIKLQTGDFRAGLNGFYSFVEDYITYQTLPPAQGAVKLPPELTDAKTVQFVNTELATLSGFELYAEYDWTDWMTPFVTVSFVEGRDHTRDDRGFPPPDGNSLPANEEEPLPGIPPLDSRLGLRFHETGPTPRYGFEVVSRMVAKQDRVATSLGEVRSAGWSILNLRSYWRVREGFLLTAGVENLFDRNYREHLDLRTGRGVFQPGRNAYVGLELEY